VQLGQDLLWIRVARGDQPGPTPPGDLADTAVPGPRAHGWTAEPLIQPTNRPCRGFGQQPQDPLAEPGAAEAGTASSGPVGQAGDAMGVVAVDPAAHRGGSQPSRSAIAVGGQRWCDSKLMIRRVPTRWGPCSSRATSQGQPAGQRRLAYPLGDAYWRRLAGRLVCGSSNGPRGYFVLCHPPCSGVTSRTSGHPLGSTNGTAAGHRQPRPPRSNPCVAYHAAISVGSGWC
jgi:hypothetical protein